MISLEEFHQDFLQSILSDAESRGIMKPQSFFEIVCEDLISVGDLTSGYTQAEYIKKGMEIYGYDFDNERNILTLLNHNFFQEEEIQTFTKNQIEAKFTRLKNFLNKCKEAIYANLEETSEAYSMAYNIYNLLKKNEVQKVRLMVITDGKATRNLIELPSEIINNIQFDFRVIDIEYLNNIYKSALKTTNFDVEVDLPCLRINDENDSYQSYLSVINGNLLVKIYEEYGQKIFEQNVRTFLQFRGNVNKGLRNTIEWHPEMFFAYNNGITATATSVEFGADNNIKKIKNFQIVNGGQTTSAIYAANKNSNLSVSKVSVQMKLSVVKKQENQDEFISKVAEYANTQNKINNSDFFSNSPFHKDIKDYANRIFAPAIGGAQRRTHWFYERVRGEYLNSQAYLKPEEKRKFQIENPKSQVVDKTLLSKTENVWQQRPDIVSKGAQESFKKFAEEITEILEKDGLTITESYFKDAISRVILFRNVEKIVTQASWYDGGFRAQTVAYTISCFSALIKKSSLYLNFNRIWEMQDIPEELKNLLQLIAEKVYSKIIHPPAGYANVTQWTKNPGCWSSVKEISVNFSFLDSNLFIDNEENQFIIKESKQTKQIDNDINKQVFIVKVNSQDWNKLFDYYRNYKSTTQLNSLQLDILEKMASGHISLPSEKQSKILYQIYLKAKKEGLDIN
jgi:hypothetical protein